MAALQGKSLLHCLTRVGLEKYLTGFEAYGIQDIEQLAKLQLTDYVRVGVTLPPARHSLYSLILALRDARNARHVAPVNPCLAAASPVSVNRKAPPPRRASRRGFSTSGSTGGQHIDVAEAAMYHCRRKLSFEDCGPEIASAKIENISPARATHKNEVSISRTQRTL